MTSQVAVFNQRGVAVASDTVATIRTGGSTRTVNNIEKIWTLGADHLVVVMVSGNLTINGVSCRVLITEWMHTLQKPLAQVRDYAENFRQWLSSEERLIHPSNDLNCMRTCIRDHFLEIRRRVVDHANELNYSDENIDEVQELFVHYTNAGIEYLQSLEKCVGAEDHLDLRLARSEELGLSDVINESFQGLPVREDFRELLEQSASLALSRWQELPLDTTLGFIGYGAEEMFSQSVKLHCRGRYGGLSRTFMESSFGQSNLVLGGSLQVFAQSGAIHGFLSGAQVDVLDLVYEEFFDQIVDLFAEEEQGLQYARESISKVKEVVNEKLWKFFIDPMLDTIASLGLRDTAELAMSLVGIQAMRANASPEPAGVGGLIEALIIDRADGVRWVQRLPR